MNEPDAKCPHCEAVTKIGGHGFTGQDATIHGQKVYLVEAVFATATFKKCMFRSL